MIHKSLGSGRRAMGGGRKHAARMIYESVGGRQQATDGGRKYGENV